MVVAHQPGRGSSLRATERHRLPYSRPRIAGCGAFVLGRPPLTAMSVRGLARRACAGAQREVVRSAAYVPHQGSRTSEPSIVLVCELHARVNESARPRAALPPPCAAASVSPPRLRDRSAARTRGLEGSVRRAGCDAVGPREEVHRPHARFDGGALLPGSWQHLRTAFPLYPIRRTSHDGGSQPRRQPRQHDARRI